MVRLAVIALVFLAFSGTANAVEPWQVGESIRIARAAWPDSRCAGREIISPEAPPESGDGDAPGGVDGSCVVRIRDDLDPHRFCVALVHEFGHLAGQPHTTSGVMSNSPFVEYAPCNAVAEPLFPISARRAASEWKTPPLANCRFVARRDDVRRVYRCGMWVVTVRWWSPVFGYEFDGAEVRRPAARARTAA